MEHQTNKQEYDQFIDNFSKYFTFRIKESELPSPV